MGEHSKDDKHRQGAEIARACQHGEAGDTATGEHHANAKHHTADEDCRNRQIIIQQAVTIK